MFSLIYLCRIYMHFTKQQKKNITDAKPDKTGGALRKTGTHSQNLHT